jgi:hypothetical protein
VKEMIEELVPQLDGFKQTITTAVVEGDPEETGRRTELTQYVHRLVIVNTILNDLRSTCYDYGSGGGIGKGTSIR